MHRPLLHLCIHPWTLAAMTVLVIGMIGLVATAHVEAFSLALSAQSMEESLVLEEDVAVILIAYGVFLEERGLLASRVFGEDVDVHQDHWNEMSERYGAYLLIMGLLMEVNDQVFEPLLLGNCLEPLGLGSMVLLDGLAILTCLVFIGQLFRKPASD